MKFMQWFVLPVAALLVLGCGGKVKENPKYNYITADETAKLIRNEPSISF